MDRPVKVKFWSHNNEWVAVECFCGHGKTGLEFVIGVNPGWGCVCPKCGREYYYEKGEIVTYPNATSYQPRMENNNGNM